MVCVRMDLPSRLISFGVRFLSARRTNRGDRVFDCFRFYGQISFFLKKSVTCWLIPGTGYWKRMKIETNSLAGEEHSDASLVAASLDGDRQAFGNIVTRYQGLLCSLAYSSLGNLSESEDVAQDTFIEAWKKLGNLREPEKLKSWLCGMLRFKISHHQRKEARQPVRQAGELQEADVLDSNEDPIETVAMKAEEQALLWQALEAVPDTYRETLILYYREHRSIEHVASELDVSEDAVKQRLSRGRKVLQEKMMSFVEGALERTAPTQVFTVAVMSTLASLSPPTKAAGAGVTAAQVGTAFKWATLVAMLASVSGFISSFFALRANLDQSRTQRERQTIIRTVAVFLGVALGYIAGVWGLRHLALAEVGHVPTLAFLSQGLTIGFVVSYVAMTFIMMKRMRTLRTEERRRRPDLFQSPEDQPGSKTGEYKSRLSLFGVPLVHAKFAMAEEGDKPAFGWIALGHQANGLLFAWGGITVAPVCVGIVTFGLISVGAVGFGPIAMGTVGVGIIAMGASAVGYKAYGSLSALGWESAFSQAFSIAREAAIGPIAFAREVNNETAAALTNLSTVGQTYVLILAIMVIMVLVPVIWYANNVRKRFRQPKAN